MGWKWEGMGGNGMRSMEMVGKGWDEKKREVIEGKAKRKSSLE
jgi:hypothetical protein